MSEPDVNLTDEVGFKKPQTAEHPGISLTIEGNVPETTESGLWVPSRKGTLITTQQWRVLDGNLKFCFNGRFIYGPGNWYWWIFVIAHLLLTTVVFIWFDVLPVLPFYAAYATTFGVLFLAAYAIYNAFQVVFTDPGYVLRPDVEERVENLVEYHADSKTDSILTKTMSVNGKEETCTFCDICCVYRSQRAKHCSICDCCIERFDRHCPTFGTCIGLRNIGAYIRFLFFTLSTFQIIQSVALKNLIESVTSHGWMGLVCSPTLYVMLISICHPPYGLLTYSWILLTQLYNLMLDRTTYEAKHNLNYSEFPEANGWRARLRVFWTNFTTLVLSAPQQSRIKPKSYVKTKAIKRISPGDNDAPPPPQPRSFLSYSLARQEVPVTHLSVRQKIAGDFRRLARRFTHIPRLTSRESSSLIHAPWRSSRVTPCPHSSGGRRIHIVINSRQQQPQPQLSRNDQ